MRAPVPTALVPAALVAAAIVAGCITNDVDPTVTGNRLHATIPNLDGEPVSLDSDEFEGRVVLVDIWGTWCPPCRESLTYLDDLHDEFEDDGLSIVGIAFEAEEDTEIRRSTLRYFAQQKGIAYTVLDGGLTGDVSKILPALQGFQGFPTMIVIGRDGTVTHANTVYVPNDLPEVREAVVQALGLEDAEA